MKFLVGVFYLSAWSVLASANPAEKMAHAKYQNWFTLEGYQIEKISEKTLAPEGYTKAYQSDCTSIGLDDFDQSASGRDQEEALIRRRPVGTKPGFGNSRRRRTPEDVWGRLLDRLIGSVNLFDKIVNTGEKIWDFLKKNAGVAEAKYTYANALPRSVKCWDELENWSLPRAETYRVSYKNWFGMEVVNFDFQLKYSYGGSLNDKGAYITNANVQYKTVKVSWGFKLDASVEVPLVTNLATRENPVAGMEVTIRWKAKGLNHVEGTQSFFIVGDGRPTQFIN